MATSKTIDLSNCEGEPIHLLGQIQSFGFLVAVSPTWEVSFVSANSADWIGVRPEDMLGRPLNEFISANTIHRVRNQLQYLHGEYDVERIFNLSLTEGGAMCDAAMHRSGEHTVFEFEPVEPQADQVDDLVRSIIKRFESIRNLHELCRVIARYVRALTGFDRVMIYRFQHDDSGEVIAETKQSELESFMGLRYPASDIPKQARELYLRNLIRAIADVNDAPVNIVASGQEPERQLDLSNSVLRSVSRIHIEYLNNMGVGASMSVSLVVRGKLWGLIACHHMSPRRLPFPVRSAAELIGQTCSLALEAREREAELADEHFALGIHEDVLRTVSDGADPSQVLIRLTDRLRDILKADGSAVRIGDQVILSGSTPGRSQFADLVEFLNKKNAGAVYITHELGAVYEPAHAYAERAAGLLAVPVSLVPSDYIVFFRKEVTSKVNWAGDPNKPVNVGPLGARLTPRKSFALWQETVRGQSEAWSETQLRIAEKLRLTILEIVLRQSRSAEQERRRAQERQEVLIAELNHRIRNILALVRGLATRSASTSDDLESFVVTFDQRIQAMARAHDHITLQRRPAASAKILLRTEASAYLADKADQLIVEGEDADLDADAFSTVSLVIHELITNSAKYGALGSSSGTVRVSLSLGADGALHMEWREQGGPPVQPPTRRGFGSTIIERSIPHDLGGEAKVEYLREGMRARLVIPATHVTPRAEEEEVGADGNQTAPNDTSWTISGPALVVEDNLIIAMDAEAALIALGAEHVTVASNVSDARAMIANQQFALALLDVNIGTGTSFPIADELADAGIPYVFASGYNEDDAYPDKHAEAPRVTKPFSTTTLRQALAELNTG